MALLLVLGGCATGPTPSSGSGTRYKGDAVWNISFLPAPQCDERSAGYRPIRPGA